MSRTLATQIPTEDDMKIIVKLLPSLIFLLLAVYALNLSISKPFHNWDMIGYIAAAKSFEEKDLGLIHRFTYDQIRHSVSKEAYDELVRDNFTRSMSSDGSAFGEILPFYQIRPVYTGLIYLLYKIGVNIVFATHLISGVAIVISFVFLYLMSGSFLPKPLVYAIPPLIFIFNVLNLARFSTPDGLAFLAVIVVAYLYQKKCVASLLFFLPLSIAIRTDLILFVFPLLCFLYYLETSIRWKVVLSAIGTAGIYFFIGYYWKNPGWPTIFIFTLYHMTTHPVSEPINLTPGIYFYTLFHLSKMLIENNLFILFIFISSFSLFLIQKQMMAISIVTVLKSPSTILAIVCLFFVISHFLAFPVAWDRFFSAPYLIGAYSLMVIATDYLSDFNKTRFR